MGEEATGRNDGGQRLPPRTRPAGHSPLGRAGEGRRRKDGDGCGGGCGGRRRLRRLISVLDVRRAFLVVAVVVGRWRSEHSDRMPKR